MSQATELLGKAVYYFEDPRLINEPVFAQIVDLGEHGVTLMVPRPERNTVEFKTWIEYSYSPKVYHWMDIDDYEKSQYWTTDV